MFFVNISISCVGGGNCKEVHVAKMENIHDFLVIG